MNDGDDSAPGDRASGDRAGRPLMVYVHVPFCSSKCHFCDWVQAIPRSDLLLGPSDERRRLYIDALCREIRHRGPELAAAGYVPRIIYWGGGTASSLTEFEIEAIAAALREAFDLGAVREATIECSPETMSVAKLQRCRELGFDRVSVGVQSMQDDRLRRLGRAHTSTIAARSLGWAAEVGFGEINVDLMCGFPDETFTEVAETIAAGLKLPVTHVSVYTFRPTSGTVLRGRLDRSPSRDLLKNQLTAASLARGMVAAALTEYAVGYFGRPALNIVMPFQLQVDTVGFGSGAISILDKQYLGHSKGRLKEYVADPTAWDFSMSARSTPVALSLLRSGLSVFGGLGRVEWEAATGSSLDDTMTAPDLAPVFSYLRSVGHLIEDEHGIRLPAGRAGSTLHSLAFQVTMADPNV